MYYFMIEHFRMVIFLIMIWHFSIQMIEIFDK